MPIICGECSSECTLVEKNMGSFLDFAYGKPKRFDYIVDVTSCCQSEDYEEVEDMPTVQTLNHLVDNIMDEADNLKKQME